MATLTEQEMTSVKAQLVIDEGRVESIYKDSEGYPTFGIGHLVKSGDLEHGKPEGTPVSAARVDQAFKADLDTAISDSNAWSTNFRQWPSEVRQIVVNMMFNMGLPTMNTFKKFKEALESNNWKKAAEEMQNSKWYGQVGDRSKRLVERMNAI
uniref:Phage lysozyme 1 n=2 Tax=Solen strictus TaxID=194331 RepID=A0A1N7TAT9_9BIVA|nr:phage lysozyme 1 [Solen strictus]